MTERPDHVFDESERKALAAALQPLPLDEARVQGTLRMAVRDLRQQRTRKRLVVLSSAASIGLLLAAGYWRWGGMDSERELSLRAAIDITNMPGDYDAGRIQAASGKVWTDLAGIIGELQQRGQLTYQVRDAVVRCIDSAEPVRVAYDHGFEEIRWKLRQGEVLSAADHDTLLAALCAGVYAIRSLGERDNTYLRSTQLMCTYLRLDVTGETRNR